MNGHSNLLFWKEHPEQTCRCAAVDLTDGRRETLLSAVSRGPLVRPGSHCLSSLLPAEDDPRDGQRNLIRVASPSVGDVRTPIPKTEVYSISPVLSETWTRFYPSVFFSLINVARKKKREKSPHSLYRKSEQNLSGWLGSTNRRWCWGWWWRRRDEPEDLLASSGCWQLIFPQTLFYFYLFFFSHLQLRRFFFLNLVFPMSNSLD